jgi:hypothetical protein
MLRSIRALTAPYFSFWIIQERIHAIQFRLNTMTDLSNQP